MTTRKTRKTRKTMRHTILGATSMVRSVARRIEDEGDEEHTNWELPELAELAHLVEEADAALVAGVRSLRNRHGYSWAQIGAELGVSRQAAQQRFGTACAQVEEAAA